MRNSLLRFEEKHRAAFRSVCAVQFLDGAQQVDACRNMNASEIRAKAIRRDTKAVTKKDGIRRRYRVIPPFENYRHAAQSDDELFRPYLTVPHLLIKKLHRYFNDLSDSYRAYCYCLMNVDGPLLEVPVE